MKLMEKLHQLGLRDEDDNQTLIDIHLAIIEKYGWIPLEEYKNIPIPMIYDMLHQITKENRELSMLKVKRHG